jgi:hypothetical protein
MLGTRAVMQCGVLQNEHRRMPDLSKPPKDIPAERSAHGETLDGNCGWEVRNPAKPEETPL